MPTPDAEIIVLGRKALGTADGPIYGQFLELAGHCINGGLYDPASPLARPDGLREDVLEAVRLLRPTHIRYPGGCAASYFDWQELVGPPAARPQAKLFRVTATPQATAFGIPEAHALCEELGCELYLTVNAHTQSPGDAANLVEYLNGTTPTKWADLRRAHGRKEPYGVRLFGLGNEIYGSWQAGQKTAEDYVAWCREAIRQMKRVDPTIRTVVCGLGRPNPEWDRTVLFGTVGLADMISVHNYFGRPILRDSMAASLVCEQMLRAMDVAIDEAVDTALGIHPRTVRDLGAPQVDERPGIAFDEWNVWYRSDHDPVADLAETFDYTDALTVASLFHVILRNTHTVRLANISLAVNTLASILTNADGVVKQTIWHGQKLIRDAHEGQIVETVVDAPTFRAKHERFFCGVVSPEEAADETRPSLVHFDAVPGLDVVTSIEAGGKRLRMSVVQKLEDRPLTARLTFRGLAPRGDSVTVHRLTGDALGATNTFDHPESVGTEACSEPLSDVVTFPPASLTVLDFAL